MSIALNIPASNGTGAASNVSGLDPEKTFVIGGTLAPGEQIVIEGTADPTGANGWAGLAVFAGSQGNVVQIPHQVATGPTQTQNLAPGAILAVVNWMRVRRASSITSTATPTVSVDSTSTATQVFQALTVPAGQGTGASTNIGAQGTTLQATVSGLFGPSESILIEGSYDGVSWDTIFAFSSPGTQLLGNGRYTLVRVTRQGVGRTPGTIQAFLGTSSSGAGGGAFPGYYGLEPEPVNNTTPPGPGVSAQVSRGDHVHGLTFSDETPTSDVGTASAPGVSLFPARTDHIHGVDATTVDTFRLGAPLPDANAFASPGSEQASARILPVLTADRTLALLGSAAPDQGTTFEVIRQDLSAHTYTVTNGVGGATLYVFKASPLTPQGARFSWDGTDFTFVDFFYVTGGTYVVPTNPLFLSPSLWLRADLGVTLVAGKASHWLDQVSARDYAQATAGLRPTFAASSVNGQPGLTFGATLSLGAATCPFAAGDTRTLIVVAKPGAASIGTFFQSRSTIRAWMAAAAIAFPAFDDFVYQDGINHASKQSPPMVLDGNGHLFEYYSTVGATMGFAFDGVAKTVVSAGGATNTVSLDNGGTAASFVGNDYTGTAGVTGDILEIIGVPGIISAADDFKLRAYIANHYGLVV